MLVSRNSNDTRGDRAARRGPHPLDEERRQARAGEQPHGGSDFGGETKRFRSNWEDGRTLELHRSAPALRHLDHALGIHGARDPRPHGGQRDRGDGGGPPAPDDAEEFLRGDQSRAGSVRTDDGTTRRNLKERLEQATGERISALEGISAAERAGGDNHRGAGRNRGEDSGTGRRGLAPRPFPDKGIATEHSSSTAPGTPEKNRRKWTWNGSVRPLTVPGSHRTKTGSTRYACPGYLDGGLWARF